MLIENERKPKQSTVRKEESSMKDEVKRERGMDVMESKIEVNQTLRGLQLIIIVVL